MLSHFIWAFFWSSKGCYKASTTQSNTEVYSSTVHLKIWLTFKSPNAPSHKGMKYHKTCLCHQCEGEAPSLQTSENLLAQLANHSLFFRCSSCPCNPWGDCCLWPAQQSACARETGQPGLAEAVLPHRLQGPPWILGREVELRDGRDRHGPGM